MELRKFLTTTIRQYLNEEILKENVQLFNKILDKINKEGERNLSYDEKIYLDQYVNKNIDLGLEKWLLSDDEDTFDMYGNKLLFDEFEDDEDIFYNRSKLKRIITKHLNKKPFTNDADWGGGYVWIIDSDNGFTGMFIYLGEDDDLVILKRTLVDDEYSDQVIKNITNSKDFYRFLLSLEK